MGNVMKINIAARLVFLLLLALPCPLIAADALDGLIAAAKQESELYFIAGPTTFGGKKGLAEKNS